MPPPPAPASDPDADLNADEGPESIANHDGYFQRAEDALILQMGQLYKNRGGSLEDTPGYVPGRFIMKALKCASWASHEDLRQLRRRTISATLRSGNRLVEASAAGARSLVDEIRELKRASDETAKRLVTATWALAGFTAILAVATMVLVLVENQKH